MSTARDFYEQLLCTADVTLARYGFKRRGTRFLRRHEESWGIIEFQRSPDSGTNWIVFTVNIGVAYDALPSVSEWNAQRARPPKSWDCHVGVRIEHVLPDRSPAEYWWLIDDATDIEQLQRAFTSYLDGPVRKFIDDLETTDGFRRYLARKAERGSIEDRELPWLQQLDPSVDLAAIASRPERLSRSRRQDPRPLDFSGLPQVIETRRNVMPGSN